MYSGSFDSDIIKQNFRLAYKKQSLIHLLYKHCGKGSLIDALGGGLEEIPFNTFNSTTLCSNLIMKLLKLSIHTQWKCKGSLQRIAYESLYNKLKNRRVDTSEKVIIRYYYEVLTKSYIDLEAKVGPVAFNLMRNYPLEPYESSYPKASAVSHVTRLSKRLSSEGIQIETILNSVYSEHCFHWNLIGFMLDQLNDVESVEPVIRPRNVHWFTRRPLSQRSSKKRQNTKPGCQNEPRLKIGG